MKNVLLLLLISIIGHGLSNAQLQKTSFNEGWNFSLIGSNNNKAKQVVLPHHWNDDAYTTRDYYRGEGIYQKEFYLSSDEKTVEHFLFFEGVNSKATVILNGKTLRTHAGGYTGFYVDLSSALQYDSMNKIEVLVDNRNTDLPPLSGDFTIFGGIYRPVWWIRKAHVHLHFDEFGGNGFLFNSGDVSAQRAKGSIEVTANNTGTSASGTVQIKCLAPDGNMVFTKSYKERYQSGLNNYEYQLPVISEPKLWSPASPQLYQLEVNLLDKNGQVLDRLKQKIGWRWLAIGDNNQLLLNGEAVKLKGASRHQDREGYGIALSDQQHVDDIKALNEMGCNFIRLAHYPQSKAVLDACDELGLLVWEEIPVVDIINNNPEFKVHARQALLEMIHQHHNHPSIIMWGYMNEAIIQVPHRSKSESERDSLYAATVDFAKELEQLCRQTDSSRFTVMAYHGTQLYNEIGLAGIAQISGWNLYDGWYGNDLGGFERFVASEHQKYPHRPLIISEFGAGSDARIHSLKPRKFDFSIEYQQAFMEHYWPVIRDSAYIMGGAMWNFIDFSSALRQESMPHINNKGLLYGNRELKDVYFYQKAFLSEEPVLHIAVRDWSERYLLDVDSLQNVKVYSNLPQVELYIDDQSVGRKAIDNCHAEWTIDLREGKHKMTAKGITADGCLIEDVTWMTCNYLQRDLSKQKKVDLNINIGSDVYYHQQGSSSVFVPDVTYEPGSWGYIGGSPLEMGDRPGTTAAVRGTQDDPLFQTQRQGDFTYRFDVAPGTYEITLHFADLHYTGQPLVYDIGATETSTTTYGKMNIWMNGTLLESGFSPAEMVGGRHRLTKSYVVDVDANKIELQFEGKQGIAFVNGLTVITK